LNIACKTFETYVNYILLQLIKPVSYRNIHNQVAEKPQVKALLRQYGLKAKKELGQHFLTDEGTLKCILSAAELSQQDIVVEVGPGLGILTKRLVEIAGKVIAVELDPMLASTLAKRLAPFPNLRVIHADILKVPPSQLLKDYLTLPELSQGYKYKVVANLPYYITSPIIHHFLEASSKPSLMVIMVQKEVGEAITSKPSKMSLLSLSVQFYSKATLIARVPAKSFYPPPKVDSVILRLDTHLAPPVEVSDTGSFFDIIKCGFGSRRKQLRNSLAQALGIPPSQVISLLEKAGLEPKRRAETLSLEEWRVLWRIFAPFRK